MHRRKPAWRFALVGVSFLILAASEILLICDIMSEFYGFEIAFFADYHIELESLAVFALGVFLFVVGTNFWQMRNENSQFRATVKLTSGEFLNEIDKEFLEWKLSDSEREVALLLIKGLTIQEICQVRNTQPGTIKSQCNAIYQKAALNGRNELSAYFIDDLLGGKDFTTTQNIAT